MICNSNFKYSKVYRYSAVWLNRSIINIQGNTKCILQFVAISCCCCYIKEITRQILVHVETRTQIMLRTRLIDPLQTRL